MDPLFGLLVVRYRYTICHSCFPKAVWSKGVALRPYPVGIFRVIIRDESAVTVYVHLRNYADALAPWRQATAGANRIHGAVDPVSVYAMRQCNAVRYAVSGETKCCAVVSAVRGVTFDL